MRVQGGFGSAGAGNRSLRRTTTSQGTASASALVRLRASKGYPARMDDPTPDEILEAVKTQFCPWCVDPRQFKSLGGHLTHWHGFRLQDIRDYIQVPKHFAFVSVAMSEDMRRRTKARYPAMKHLLVPKAGQKRQISAYGKASQLKRLVLATTPEMRAQVGRINTENNKVKFARLRTCTVCGSPKQNFYETCSRACGQIYRSARKPPQTDCSVPGCTGRFVAKGYCNKHYRRERTLKGGTDGDTTANT